MEPIGFMGVNGAHWLPVYVYVYAYAYAYTYAYAYAYAYAYVRGMTINEAIFVNFIFRFMFSIIFFSFFFRWRR